MTAGKEKGIQSDGWGCVREQKRKRKRKERRTTAARVWSELRVLTARERNAEESYGGRRTAEISRGELGEPERNRRGSDG